MAGRSRATRLSTWTPRRAARRSPFGVDGGDHGPAARPHSPGPELEVAEVHLGQRTLDELRELAGEGGAGHFRRHDAPDGSLHPHRNGAQQHDVGLAVEDRRVAEDHGTAGLVSSTLHAAVRRIVACNDEDIRRRAVQALNDPCERPPGAADQGVAYFDVWRSMVVKDC